MSVALSRAAKEGIFRRGSASAGARNRRWAEPAVPGPRVSAPRPRAHRGTWRTAHAARNSRLGLAPPARVLAPGLRRLKHANGIRKNAFVYGERAVYRHIGPGGEYLSHRGERKQYRRDGPGDNGVRRAKQLAWMGPRRYLFRSVWSSGAGRFPRR
jgi:hypothetical protein